MTSKTSTTVHDGTGDGTPAEWNALDREVSRWLARSRNATRTTWAWEGRRRPNPVAEAWIDRAQVLREVCAQRRTDLSAAQAQWEEIRQVRIVRSVVTTHAWDSARRAIAGRWSR